MATEGAVGRAGFQDGLYSKNHNDYRKIHVVSAFLKEFGESEPLDSKELIVKVIGSKK